MKINRKRIFPVVFLSGALLLTGCNGEDTTAAEEVKVREIPVEISEVTFGALTDTQLLTGKIQAENEVSIFPNAVGKIQEITVKKGDIVQKGQVIAKLDSTDEQNAVKQAEISLKQAKLSLEDAKQSQVDGLKNIELQVKSAQNAYDAVKKDLERYKQLYDEGLISEKEYEGIVIQEQNARIQLEQVLLSQEQAGRTTGIRSLETTVEQAELSLQAAKKRLDDKLVKATISGQITSLNGEVGEMASSQSPFATIVAMDKVKLMVNIIQEQLDTFSVGDTVDVEVIGLSGTFKGIVTYVSSVSTSSGLFTLEVSIDNKDQLIKPGMVASINTEEILEQDKLMVPTNSIIQKEGKSVVFIVEDNKAVLKEVQVVRYNTELTAVTGDLKEKDKVVTSGQNLLNDGDLVKVMEED